MELAVPKLRSGSYFPDWLLERRRRAQRALTTVVATCYLLGVSTGRMEELVETLGITRLSKSPDPLVGSQCWLNGGLIRLSEASDRRARILLADGGYGKSHELQIEIERLRDAGEYVASVDLGELTSAADGRDAIASIAYDWAQSGASGDLHLTLDAFDEPLVDVINLVDVLKTFLGKLDWERLRLLIVSRPAVWSRSLKSTFVDWWGPDEAVTLHLQALSDSDIGVAARSDGIDPDAFLGTVRRAGALALARARATGCGRPEPGQENAPRRPERSREVGTFVGHQRRHPLGH